MPSKGAEIRLSLLHGAFLAIIVLAPLPLASNREWSWTLCCLLIGSVGFLWAVGQIVGGASAATLVKEQSRLTPLLQLCFIAVIAWAVIQARPLVPEAWSHPLWSLAAESLDSSMTPAISLAPDDTMVAAMRLLCYGLVFFLAFQWCRDERLARRTLQALVLAAVAYAIYGLGKYWAGSETLFWFEDTGYRNNVHGTFVNRNHFATYIGLALLCALVLFHEKMTHLHPPAASIPGSGRFVGDAGLAPSGARTRRGRCGRQLGRVCARRRGSSG